MTAAGPPAALTPQYDLTVEDRIMYRDASWSMTRRRGGTLDFVDPRTGELLAVTDEELAGLICSGQARIVRAGASEKDERYAAAVADLSTIRSADIADGRRAMAYTDELRWRGLTYRASEASVQKAIDHVAIRIADPDPPRPYLLKRWLKRGRARAAGGGRGEDQIVVGDLVPQHGFKGNRGSRVCFEVSKIIHRQIDRVYLTCERRSVESLLAVVRDAVRTVNEDREAADQLRIPGRKAVLSAIAALPREEVIRRRHGADKAYDAVGPVEYRARPEAPLDEVEIDHTKCDLFVVDGLTGAPLGRATVAVGADRCTGMPWGLHVGFDPPSVHTTMQVIRNGMFPKTYVRIYADAGVWDIEGSWPAFGRPHKIGVDRGAENLNHDVRALGVDLPIKIVEAKAGRKGRLKGQVERFLGTLNRTLLHEQRGTTFSNVVDRDDYDPKKNAVITYEELLELLHKFIVDVYIVRRHGGTRDVPLRLWNEKIQVPAYRPQQVENVASLLPLFGRIEHRILRRDGIRWKHLFFTSPSLMALLSDGEFLKASTNAKGDVVVRFRYDPSNIDHIHVYLPHARGEETMHLRVPVEKRATEYARGLSVWAHDAILKIAREKANAAIDLAALDRARAKLVRSFEEDTPGSARARHTTRIARIRQIGGIAPYGDSVRTTPVGSFEDQRQEAAVTSAGAGGPEHRPPPTAANDGGLPLPCEMDLADEDEAFEDDAPAKAARAGKPPFTRGSDPPVGSRQSSRRGSAGGRKMKPTVDVSGGDEIDFYSEEAVA